MAGIHLQLNPSIYVHVHRPGAVLFFFPSFFFFFFFLSFINSLASFEVGKKGGE